MTDLPTPSLNMIQNAVAIYRRVAWGDAPAASVAGKFAAIADATEISQIASLLEPQAGAPISRVLRLGQPQYPHMKIMFEPVAQTGEFLFRADAHDSHLNAPEGSPDAAWLAAVRASNQALVEKIEHAWQEAGILTFRSLLRQQIAARKAGLAEK